jgi:hypothetical protein
MQKILEISKVGVQAAFTGRFDFHQKPGIIISSDEEIHLPLSLVPQEIKPIISKPGIGPIMSVS